MTNTTKKLFRLGILGVALASLGFVLIRRANTFYSLQPLEAHQRVCALVSSKRWDALAQDTTVLGLQQLRYLTSPGESKSVQKFIEDKKPLSYIHSLDVVGVHSDHNKAVYFMYRYSRPQSRWLLWNVTLAD